MKLNQIKDNKGARQSRVRVGRGIGSGLGKTAGRGQKGAKSRSGVSIAGFEGGQMPLHMRIPKRGFNNIFARDYAEVNIGAVQKAIDAGKLDIKGVLDHDALKAAGLARGGKDGVRLTGFSIPFEGQAVQGFSGIKYMGDGIFWSWLCENVLLEAILAGMTPNAICGGSDEALR
mgnify:CR=1 FL=1